MKKVYLVDSENVGDVWVPLLIASQEDDEVLVFYTQKSPHMNYETIRMLKETDKEAVFVKCFEGSNALDFQLVTELGYRLRGDRDCDYVIVSNDTGYDAVTRYWGERKMSVSRLSGADCAKQVNPPKKQQKLPKEEETDSIVKQLCSCFGKEKLAEFHNALVVFFGKNAGKALYQNMKADPKWNRYWSEIKEPDQKEKFDIYCRTVFAHSELADSYPQDFAAFLVKAGAKRENLNSLRAALQGHYGKEKGMKYYSLIKPHVKIINRM